MSALSRSLRVGIVVAVMTAIYCAAILARYDFDPLSFVQIGAQFSNESAATQFGYDQNGYDGQFAYYIATEGFNATPKLDQPPAIRYQRILYPLLSAVLAFGQRDLIPWTMILINVLAHGVAAGSLAYLLRTRTRASEWWSLVPALWVGTLVSIRLDLNEPLAIALSLLGVAVYLSERRLLGALILAAAGLAKELGLVLAAGLILYELAQRDWRRALRLAILALAPFALWLLILRVWLGAWTDTTLGGVTRLPIPIPFAGLFYASDALSFGLILTWAMIPAAVLLIAILLRLRRGNVKAEVWLGLAAAGFVAFTPPATIAELISTLRILQPLLAATILYFAAYQPRRLFWFAALWSPSVLLALLIVLR
ncbi:MAG: hypothetical protein KF726_24655 [Anaerolineae bacterium]|nr:hypothetical protein [Anaerolineae bacterium]